MLHAVNYYDCFSLIYDLYDLALIGGRRGPHVAFSLAVVMIIYYHHLGCSSLSIYCYWLASDVGYDHRLAEI